MRKATVVLGVVLLVGYSAYGALFLVGASAHRSLADETTGGEFAPADPGAAPDDGGAGNSSESSSSSDVEKLFQEDSSFNFTNVSRQRGFDYEYEDKYFGNNQLITNAGVYVSDYDNDDWPDVLAIGGEQPVLFHNAGGTFERSGALPDFNRSVRSAVFLDYDNDGWQDLLLLVIGRGPLLLENREGSFVPVDAGFDVQMENPTTAAVGDYNDDGCRDVFVGQNGNWSNDLPMGFQNYSAPTNDDNGNRDYLFRGTCSGFERVNESGIEGTRWTLASSFVDLTGDGRQDIHTANDFNHDVVYVNEGNGTFRQVVLGERTNRNGMASEIADVNGDGRLDVFVTNIFYPDWAAKIINNALQVKANGNNLLINRGNGTFDERAAEWGVENGGWGWAAIMADFDNDADEDLFHTTREMSFEMRDARFTDAQREKLRRYTFYSAPVFWERTDDGFRKIDQLAAGLYVSNGRGTAQLDYDRDGALDMVVASTGSYKLYENRNAVGDAVQVDIRTPENASALEARVYVEAGNTTQMRLYHSRTDFLSQDSRVMHVGVGDRSEATVRVVWADGSEREFTVAAGTRVVVTREGVERRIPLDGGDGDSNALAPPDASGPLAPAG